MKVINTTILVFFCLMINTQNVYSDISRGCYGTIQVELQSDPNIGYAIANMDGRGRCKNKTNANNCRVRAARAIERCSYEIWDNRWSNNRRSIPDKPPQSCTQSRGDSIVRDFKMNPVYLRNINTNEFDLKYAMEKAACCPPPNAGDVRPAAGALRLDLFSVSSGDKGCGSKKQRKYSWGLENVWSEKVIIYTGYEVNCPRFRSQGFCN